MCSLHLPSFDTSIVNSRYITSVRTLGRSILICIQYMLILPLFLAYSYQSTPQLGIDNKHITPKNKNMLVSNICLFCMAGRPLYPVYSCTVCLYRDFTVFEVWLHNWPWSSRPSSTIVATPPRFR